MALFERFYPYAYEDSAYELDYEELYGQGFRGIIFDIDNTLVEHGRAADLRSVELFERLRNIGFKTCVISNNKEPRVASFANEVQTQYIYKAGKPAVKNYIKAMELMETDRQTTFFVGDQIFTDVWGANRTGIRTYLVKPIDVHEEIQIVLKRYLENIVLWFYKRR